MVFSGLSPLVVKNVANEGEWLQVRANPGQAGRLSGPRPLEAHRRWTANPLLSALLSLEIKKPRTMIGLGRLGCSESVVRGTVELPTFRFSGVAVALLPIEDLGSRVIDSARRVWPSSASASQSSAFTKTGDCSVPRGVA